VESQPEAPGSDLAEADLLLARADLVRDVALHSGVTDEGILSALSTVPRHCFVPDDVRNQAYLDRALPIGERQTISQPSMLALMFWELDVQPNHRVLEIGAGSGYAAALLGQLAAEVIAVEIVSKLSQRARALLERLGYGNVRVIEGNGHDGFPGRAPYDRILVSAAAEEVPNELVRELAPFGRLVMPVGDELGQELVVGDKAESGEMSFRRGVPCIFVPLIAS
jgi:protein-L-isoaspartate(D-aspartate) O-methyltransferase